jgi:hypothetical protein
MGMIRLASLAATAAIACAAAEAQQSGPDDRGIEFDGVYVGVSFSTQNIIGGAQVGGVDVLSQKVRPMADVFIGWRKEFGGGFVLGLEAGVGLENGDMRNASGSIEWSNDLHWRYGGIAGWRYGDGPLMFVYLNETKRDFDVRLQGPGGSFTQKDGQGLLRFGVGAEFEGTEDVNFRVSVGTSRADFGDQAISFEPKLPAEFELGAIYQF